MAQPYLPNIEQLIQAGINPKTGLPSKISSTNKCDLKGDLKKFLRLIDEQDAVNRYTWFNLPGNITSQELERMIYYRGQLCFFYDKDVDQFYFMPYALDGTVDFYGRFNRIHPIPFNQGKDEKANKMLTDLLYQKKLNCVYGIKLDVKLEDFLNSAVLLHDYTKQLPETIIPRANINDAIIDVMSECIPMARTARMLGTGVKGIRVQDEDQAGNVIDANRSLEECSLRGQPYAPIVGKIDFQELSSGSVAKSEEYMLALQTLDNLRLSGYGIDNGGLFEKKAHILQSEMDLNGGPVGLVLQDGLSIRQNFCNIVNSIWGLGIWCEPSEVLSKADINGDGLLYDRKEPAEQLAQADNMQEEVEIDD